MSIGEILSLAMEYTFVGLICAAAISIAIRTQKKEMAHTQELEKQQREDLEAQQKKNEELLNILLRELKSNHHDVSQESRIIGLEKEINNILKELLYATNSGRAYFIRYHNGGHDLNKISFLKMSMTNEATRQGVSSALQNFTNQFRAIFPWLIESLGTGAPVHVNDLEKIKNLDNSLYQYLGEQNVTRAHAICIRNSNEQVIGFIAISYLTNDVYLENEKIEECLKIKQAKLETLLSYQEHSE